MDKVILEYENILKPHKPINHWLITTIWNNEAQDSEYAPALFTIHSCHSNFDTKWLQLDGDVYSISTIIHARLEVCLPLTTDLS